MLTLRKLMIGALLLSSAGCFVTASKMLDGWVGAPEPQLISKWGAPNRTYDLSDGSRVLTFQETPTCQRSFTVRAGTVVAWSSTGSCPSEYRK